MRSELNHLAQTAQAYLFKSAELKRQVAEQCIDAILAAADLMADTFGSAAKCCCAATAAVRRIANTWRLSSSAGLAKSLSVPDCRLSP